MVQKICALVGSGVSFGEILLHELLLKVLHFRDSHWIERRLKLLTLICLVVFNLRAVHSGRPVYPYPLQQEVKP